MLQVIWMGGGCLKYIWTFIYPAGIYNCNYSSGHSTPWSSKFYVNICHSFPYQCYASWIVTVRKCPGKFFNTFKVFAMNIQLPKASQRGCNGSMVVGSFCLKSTILNGTLPDTLFMFEPRFFALGNSFLFCLANLFRQCAKHVTCMGCGWNTVRSIDAASLYDAACVHWRRRVFKTE